VTIAMRIKGGRSVCAAALAVVLLGTTAAEVTARDGAELLGAAETTLRREPQIRPAALGSDPIEELRYGNAAEGIDLVQAPEATSDGGAELALPISIPPGRGGVQPDLTLRYDSGADAGWLGAGWDLDLGSVEVDTTFGVPRYIAGKESETYLLDGDQLAPNAVRMEFVDRVGPRAEFTRRVDTKHELVIRHGTDPTNYWWEVRDKLGGIRWYGGNPDLGGPDGNRKCNPDPDSDEPGEIDDSWEGIDESAVLRGPGGAIFRWALSATRDVGVNMMRLKYDKVSDQPVGADGDALGTQLYPREITYTHGSPVNCHPEDPAYKVKFLRDNDIDPQPARRKDVIVDASGGFVQVTRDLLRRIEVWTGDPEDDESLRDFDQLSKAFDLRYREGAFGKALLERVDQRGSDNAVFAHNELDYYDDVRDGSGDYDGFETDHPWETHDDSLFQNIISAFGSSALGASESNAADAHAYLGFSPTGPTKTTSIGGALSVNGGATEAVVEFLDINGDGLPDKVFREVPGEIRFRLNQSGPSGNRTFEGGDPAPLISDLSSLSTDFGIGVGGGVEAYLGGSIQFSVGADVQVGEEYFEDVNNDGLPDFVSGGTVLFNHLDENGIPTFERSSSQTRAPIGVRDLDLPNVDALDKLETDQRAGSPLQDTVRRWIAPYAGWIDIDAPVTFDPQPDTRKPRPPAYDGDGVRLTIQSGPTDLWSARLETPGESATPTDVAHVHVAKGQAVYFRVQSVDEGVLDQVRWDPRISYTAFDHGDGGPEFDVNNRPERVYRASSDFTLAGRPAPIVPAPLDGTLRFDATLTKTRPVTDDIDIVLQKNGVDVVRHRVDDREILPDGLHIQTDIPVVAPTDDPHDGYADSADLFTVRLETDSDIDVTALDWRPRLYYTAATRDGQPVQVVDANGKRLLELPVLPYIDLYPRTLDPSPPEGFESHGGEPWLVTKIRTTGAQPGTKVTVSVKSREGLLAKRTLTINSSDENHVTEGRLDLEPVDERRYWIELSFHSDLPSEVLKCNMVLPCTEVRMFPGGVDGLEMPHSVKLQGPQGYFPLPYRGWGYAGYSGGDAPPADPIDEQAFEFRRSDFSEVPPTTWDEDGRLNPANGRAYPFIPYQLELKAEDGSVTGTAGVWRGAKDTIVGGAGFARASRRGVDDPVIVDQPAAPSVGGSVRAPRRVGITAPTFALTAGIGPLGASVGGAPSFGLLDYIDMNGDGFPDVLSPGNIKMTGPRGAYRENSGGPDVVNWDTTVALGGGFGGSAVSPKADSRGEANTPQGASASSGKRKLGTGRTYSPDGAVGSSGALYGFNIGGSLGIEAELTNPQVPPDWTGELGDKESPTLEQDFADVNGDGLPDRITGSPSGVDVELNLGYDFTEKIRWSDGGFESGESFSGNVGAILGFQYNFKEFAGGLSYNEGIGLARYTWIDINGDGILDRLRKDATEVRVAFGTGSGLMDEIDYGAWAEGFIDLGIASFDLGEQIAQDRSRGAGGGVDFTFGIGPLCPPTPLCYIIVNPGVHFDHTVANTAVAVVDIDGDGAPDSVRSNDDDEIEVRRNKVGRSNLLKSVKNSLGGELRLDYEREGNTTKQPASQWTLASVEIDDGHSGDGKDVQLRTYEYEDGVYDPLERQELGYATVTEHQRNFQGDGDIMDDPELRTIERTYRNATIFDSGLPKKEIVKTPSGRVLRESESTWETAELEDGEAVDARALNADERLHASLSPRRTKLELRWYDADGSLGEETWHDFRYDELGNVVWQHDEGEPEDAGDDLYAETTPSDCHISMSQDFKDRLEESQAYTCGGAPPEGRISPLWDPDRCPTWTSIPARFEVRDGAGRLLRSRDGAKDLCDNSSMTRLEERTGNGGEVAVTELDYDDWGSYNHIAYPGEDGERVVVDYVYDEHNHARVGETTDSHGVVAKATFDGITGRIASRTDANGRTTAYTYDQAHRLKSIAGPLEYDPDDPSKATVSFDYRTNEATPVVLARHFDAFHPDDPIETAAFADGLGRKVQTKRDATVHNNVADAPSDVMVVEDSVEFDALGQQIRTWYPMKEPLGQAHVYNAARTTPSTATAYNTAGRVVDITHPDDTHTTFDYGFGGEDVVGAKVFTTTVTDRAGKPQRSYSDTRNNVLASEERPDGADVRRTRFHHEPLGELTRVVEPGGGTSEHGYDLMGRRTSIRTPDAGLLERRYDVASNLVAEVTPRLRAANAEIAYSYDQERLTGITYPDLDVAGGTPDVTLAWGSGAEGEAPNGIARVLRVSDGARDQRLEYDTLGRVSKETSLMKVPGYDESPDTIAQNTYTTGFGYDTFGRLRQLTYPDGEVLSHDYDSGGLLKSMEGVKAGRTYGYVGRLEYDEFDAERLRTMGNGSRTVYAYDSLTRRLDRQVTDTPEREIQDLNYTYDDVGNVLKLDNQLPAPVTSLKGGPGSQNYRYDPYHRLLSADGVYFLPSDKRRDHTFANTYDLAGNVVSKTQTDVISGGGKDTTVDATTYSKAFTHHGTRVHQMTAADVRLPTYDANGNLTGWPKAKNTKERTLAWDTADNMRSITDGGTTRYEYDVDGDLAIERAGGSVRAFVNDWYAVLNGGKAFKYVWANESRLAAKRVANDPSTDETVQRYLHEDLQGSVNVITDDRALVTQHSEYFPTGEVWVREDVTNGLPPNQVGGDAEPYQYAGGFLSDPGGMTNFGERWYDPRDQAFTAPDPLLTEQPGAVIADPGLLPDYTYAESNPVRLTDERGTKSTTVQDPWAKFNATRRPAPPAVQAQVQGGGQAAGPPPPAIPRRPAGPGGATPAKTRIERLESRLSSVADALDAYPLVEMTFLKTGDGFKLEGLGISPSLGFYQFKPVDRELKRRATPLKKHKISKKKSK